MVGSESASKTCVNPCMLIRRKRNLRSRQTASLTAVCHLPHHANTGVCKGSKEPAPRSNVISLARELVGSHEGLPYRLGCYKARKVCRANWPGNERRRYGAHSPVRIFVYATSSKPAGVQNEINIKSFRLDLVVHTKARVDSTQVVENQSIILGQGTCTIPLFPHTPELITTQTARRRPNTTIMTIEVSKTEE